MTKKIAILIALLYIAGTVSGQEFTFQGLPWGATREQVIERLGVPTKTTRIMTLSVLEYNNVKLSGYNVLLNILVVADQGIIKATYQFEELSQNIYHEVRQNLIMKYGESSGARKPFIEYWNKNNFHVALIISREGMEISYLPDSTWEAFLIRYNDISNF
jgi:hypothetical protein